MANCCPKSNKNRTAEYPEMTYNYENGIITRVLSIHYSVKYTRPYKTHVCLSMRTEHKDDHNIGCIKRAIKWWQYLQDTLRKHGLTTQLARRLSPPQPQYAK